MMNWKDIYQLPLHKVEYGSWVYDANHNFVFQFEVSNEAFRNKVIDILNGVTQITKGSKISHKDGYIYADDTPIILIRGWGNLTGVGAHNLSGDEAANIQDTFADWIVQQLTSN